VGGVLGLAFGLSSLGLAEMFEFLVRIAIVQYHKLRPAIKKPFRDRAITPVGISSVELEPSTLTPVNT
jgi:hypothetical protein